MTAYNAIFKKFEEAAKSNVEYEPELKATFHRASKALLKAVAEEMGYTEGSYDLRSNKGGVAVSGEITLHTDNLYVKIQQMSIPGAIALVRSVKNRKDYTGGSNNYMSIEDFRDRYMACAKLKKIRRQSDAA